MDLTKYIMSRPLNRILAMILLVLIGSACSSGIAAESAVFVAPGGNSNEKHVLLKAPEGATLTPTPFQPLPPTPTYIPTLNQEQAAFPTLIPPSLTPTPELLDSGSFPQPSSPLNFTIPPPGGLLPQPDGQINIVLLGSDERPEVGGVRTDTILLLTINPDHETVSLISFPRDLYVYIPGWDNGRINTAIQHGSFEGVKNTFEYNFGVRPDHYIMINFNAFVEVIDSLGGIDVQVPVPLADNRDYVGWFSLPAGLVHMDGSTALWYVRSRMTTSDFDRTRRQQEIIQATFEKLISINGIANAPELYSIYKDTVSSDMNFTDIAPLILVAAKMTDTSKIRHYYVGPAQVTGWFTPGGAAVLLPYREAIMEIIFQAMTAP
jgi:LCP family protein required for cell wall assembly